uniref:Uncharacterized protein n=1 Tax=Anguilla anguilla TaxID=7936 RepID=A0A0E9VI91_ANGAN
MYICMCVFIYMIAVILHHITLLIHFKCDQRLQTLCNCTNFI